MLLPSPCPTPPQREPPLTPLVRDTDNGGIDARLLFDTTEIANGVARKLRVDTSAFDIDSFINKYVPRASRSFLPACPGCSR